MEKRKYITPDVEVIRLDNEISLQLLSPTTNTDYENFGNNGAARAARMNEEINESYTFENW